MMISGGENIYPAEVENAMAAHPAVAEVAVIGVPDPRWGEAVKACVVLKPGQALEEATLIAWTRDQLAHYKCPKSVDFVTTLPRNPSGKLLKRVLREPFWQQQGRQVG
jgi:fatty-acyl-CoA synthase